MVKIVTSADFESEVVKSEIPVLVDFFASWCGPCKIIAPFIEEIAEETKGKVNVFKLDVDDSQDIAQDYRVLSIPTLIFFKNGEVADKIVGAVSKDIILEKLAALM